MAEWNLSSKNVFQQQCLTVNKNIIGIGSGKVLSFGEDKFSSFRFPSVGNIFSFCQSLPTGNSYYKMQQMLPLLKNLDSWRILAFF